MALGVMESLRLVVIAHDHHRWTVRVSPGHLIGRDPSCAIVLDDDRVSRHHARVERREGRWVLQDLGSRNGIFVGAERVTEAELTEDNPITVGRHQLSVDDVASVSSRRIGETVSPPPADAIIIRHGEERYAPDRRRWAETDWPNRGDSAFHRFDALVRCAAETARAMSAEEALRGLLDAALLLSGSSQAAVFLTDGRRDTPTLGEIARRGAATSEPLVAAARSAFEANEHRGMLVSGRGAALVVLEAGERKRGVLAVQLSDASPPRRDDLEILVACAALTTLALENLRHRDQLEAENQHLRGRLVAGHALVGESRAMRLLREQVARAAATGTTVLVRGESGTGKELVAHAIHRSSTRREGPFVVVNCGAITPTLIQSELFGHEKGAFSGADRARAGVFEQADGGTLFLDEVGELPLDAQVQLLRVLETMTVTRVGATRSRSVDLRVVAATHRDLEEMVTRKTFREDLFYRLCVLPLETPPLRDRLDDVRMLCEHLLRAIGPRVGRRIRAVADDALEELVAYHWPGNVRELRNTLERAAILSQDDVIDAGDLGRFRRTALPSADGSDAPDLRSMEAVEAAHIARVLDAVDWNKTRAAEVLGLRRQTVYDKIRLYGLSPPTGRRWSSA